MKFKTTKKEMKSRYDQIVGISDAQYLLPYREGLSSQKNVFVQFLKNDELTNAFTDWCNRKM